MEHSISGESGVFPFYKMLEDTKNNLIENIYIYCLYLVCMECYTVVYFCKVNVLYSMYM